MQRLVGWTEREWDNDSGMRTYGQRDHDPDRRIGYSAAQFVGGVPSKTPPWSEPPVTLATP